MATQTHHHQSHAVVSQFLTDLPSSNPDNFQKWSAESPKQNFTKKPTSYVPVRDGPFQQVIVTEKTNILLRYLHQQFDKKNVKSGQTPAGGSKRENANNLNEEELARKRPRLD